MKPSWERSDPERGCHIMQDRRGFNGDASVIVVVNPVLGGAVIVHSLDTAERLFALDAPMATVQGSPVAGENPGKGNTHPAIADAVSGVACAYAEAEKTAKGILDLITARPGQLGWMFSDYDMPSRRSQIIEAHSKAVGNLGRTIDALCAVIADTDAALPVAPPANEFGKRG